MYCVPCTVHVYCDVYRETFELCIVHLDAHVCVCMHVYECVSAHYLTLYRCIEGSCLEDCINVCGFTAIYRTRIERLLLLLLDYCCCYYYTAYFDSHVYAIVASYTCASLACCFGVVVLRSTEFT
jgi:hypothetical protein